MIFFVADSSSGTSLIANDRHTSISGSLALLKLALLKQARATDRWQLAGSSVE
jgi:hypothetical protein